MVFPSLCVVIGYTSRVEGQYKSPGVGLVVARCVAFWVTGSDNPQVVGSSPTGRTEQSPSHPVYLSDAAGFFSALPPLSCKRSVYVNKTHFSLFDSFLCRGSAAPGLGIEIPYPLTPCGDGRSAAFDGIVRQIRAMPVHTYFLGRCASVQRMELACLGSNREKRGS